MSCVISSFGGTNSPLSLSKSTNTTSTSLLNELQVLWNEIGEGEDDRDRMILQLEQECLEICRRKVENTRKYKSDLHQSLADAEAEITQLASALGEQAPILRMQYGNAVGNLKQKIAVISPILENLRQKKQERVKEISEIEFQAARICAEISGNDHIIDPGRIQVDEIDLTTKKLGELKFRLHELQTEKNLRLHEVNSQITAIHNLAIVMSLDFEKIMADIHPSFLDSSATGETRRISNETLARLTSELNSLKQEKLQRLLKVQEIGKTLIKLWDLMDFSKDERERFHHVTSLVGSAVDKVKSQGCLSDNVIEQAQVEVECLNVLKVSKMKELLFKRQSEIEEIYKEAHMDVDSKKERQILVTCIESGSVDLSDLLSSKDDEIVKAKEVAQSRMDILDKVEKWAHASEEENWLDEYERDSNRYSVGRGVHKNLKRAEKARILVSKIPSLVDSLTAKVKAWELEKGMPFLYDKAPLLKTLDEFSYSRKEKEEEKRKSREQRKLHGQLPAEQDVHFGTKPSVKKPLCQSTFANSLLATPNSNRLGTASARFGITGGKDKRDSGKVVAIPLNYVALAKDDREV